MHGYRAMLCNRLCRQWCDLKAISMTSPNGNIFRVTGHLCGEFTGHRWIPRTKASAVFFDLRLNEWLRKQSWGWWCETQSRPLWRHSNGRQSLPVRLLYSIPGVNNTLCWHMFTFINVLDIRRTSQPSLLTDYCREGHKTDLFSGRVSSWIS